MAMALLAGSLFLAVPSVARADDDEVKPAPRTAVTIGGASVVLVAANDKLYAFVDRLDDNAPVADAELDIDTADGGSIAMHRAPMTMNRATAGMFVGDLKRAGHMQDAFMVTLRSSAGEGQEPAEIIYNDVPDRAAPAAPPAVRSQVAIALVSGGIGAIIGALFILWRRNARRRVAASLGSTQAA